MASYTQQTDFTAKDSLPTGDANKKILGADHDLEFGLIETAVNSKLDQYSAASALTALDDDNDSLSIYDDSAGTYKRITIGNARGELTQLTSIVSGSLVSAASVDFTDLSTSYRAYLLVIDDFLPATAGLLGLQTSTDNGSTFDAGGTDYEYAYEGRDSGGGSNAGGDNAANAIVLMDVNHDNVAGGECSGHIWIHAPADSGQKTTVVWQLGYDADQPGGSWMFMDGAGQRAASEANDAFTLVYPSGNIATGNYHLYGLRA